MKKTIRKRLASLEDATASEIMALAEELATELETDDTGAEEIENLDDEIEIDEDGELDDLEGFEDEAEDQEEVEVPVEQAPTEATDGTVPDEKAVVDAAIAKTEEEVEKAEIAADCKELEAKIAKIEKKASETKSGVEDTIGDEAHGGDPSTSEVAPGGDDVDVSTDKQVFPTNSEYVASITKRLDRVATVLEKRGMKRMAFRIDKLSDQLEASVR